MFNVELPFPPSATWIVVNKLFLNREDLESFDNIGIRNVSSLVVSKFVDFISFSRNYFPISRSSYRNLKVWPMNVWEHLHRSSVSRQKFLMGVKNVRLILYVTLLLSGVAPNTGPPGGAADSSQNQDSDDGNGGKSY